MRKAYSYIRFSTPDQAKGDSFRRQAQFARRYCDEHSLQLDTTLKLSDLGVSAFKGNNVRTGALAGFLEAVKGGRVAKGSVLILESLDRLSRDQLDDAHSLFKSILRAGVHIVTCNPEREYTPTDLNDLIGIIEPLLYFFRAHEESATKSKRVAESWSSRRKKAVESQVPMTTVGPKWLRLADGRWECVPERTKVVQSIFRWCREGLGTYAVAKRLNAEKVANWGRGSKWNTAYVRLILTDRRAIGEYQPKRLTDGKMKSVGEPIADYFPAVVDADTFYAALGQIKRRTKRAGRGGGGRENILSGLVFNAADRSKMYFNTDRTGRPFLDSTSGYYGGQAPKGRSFPYRPVESAVLSVLVELSVNSLTPTAKAPDRLEAAEGRLLEVNQKLSEANLRATTATDFTLYLDLIGSLGEERKELVAEVDRLKGAAAAAKDHSLSQTQNLIRLRDSVTGEERTALNRRLRAGVEELVESVWVLIVPSNRLRKVCYVQVNLRNGESRTRVVFHPESALLTEGTKLADYSKVDLRKWVERSNRPSRVRRSPS